MRARARGQGGRRADRGAGAGAQIAGQVVHINGARPARKASSSAPIGTIDIAEACTARRRKSTAPKYACPMAPYASWASTTSSCICTADVNVELTVVMEPMRSRTRLRRAEPRTSPTTYEPRWPHSMLAEPQRRPHRRADGRAASAAAFRRGRAGRVRRAHARHSGVGSRRRRWRDAGFLSPRPPADFRAIAELVERSEPADAVTLGEYLQTGPAGGGRRPRLSRAARRRHPDRRQHRCLCARSCESARCCGGSSRSAARSRPARYEPRAARSRARGARRAARVRDGRPWPAARAGVVPLKSILPETIDRIDMLYHSTSDITGVPSGFAEIDKMTAGLQRGELIIVAGRPSMGKTSLAMNIAENAAIGRQVPHADLQHGNVGRGARVASDLLHRRASTTRSCAAASFPTRIGGASLTP